MNDIDKLISLIIEKNLLQKKYLQKSVSELNDEEYQNLEYLIKFYDYIGYSIKFQADSYIMFIEDSMEETKYFIENNKYRYSKLSEVEDSIYFNDDYMTKYMIGLALSTYFWKSHLIMKRWFIEKIKQLNDCKNKYFLEIGPGHGEYFSKVLKVIDFKGYDAIDLSESSVKLTSEFVKFTIKDCTKNYKIICDDFFKHNFSNKYDMVVMGEVLEHVENPKEFLEKIYSVSTEDARVYITTVINGPAKDHITLFRTREEVFNIVRNAGFEVEDYLCTVSNGISIEKAIKKRACINIALFLKK